jgi:hypothetical protein
MPVPHKTVKAVSVTIAMLHPRPPTAMIIRPLLAQSQAAPRKQLHVVAPCKRPWSIKPAMAEQFAASLRKCSRTVLFPVNSREIALRQHPLPIAYWQGTTSLIGPSRRSLHVRCSVADGE